MYLECFKMFYKHNLIEITDMESQKLFQIL